MRGDWMIGERAVGFFASGSTTGWRLFSLPESLASP